MGILYSLIIKNLANYSLSYFFFAVFLLFFKNMIAYNFIFVFIFGLFF